ncbi:hypothetical protein KKA27_02005 [Patescibacteria group bacterium]|nr:hypothetical protein [Patescibacteria group bacterium]MBU2632946.1 hypothetical protein [Patescibacteria group bacterium]
MVQVTKKNKETTLSLLKRFSRKIKKSGNVLKFKKTRFKQRPESDLRKKRGALVRIKIAQKTKKLYKLGKITPYNTATTNTKG